MVEHNLDLIKCADYIIDLGPEGGLKGGTLVGEGTPEGGRMQRILYRAVLKGKLSPKKKSK